MPQLGQQEEEERAWVDRRLLRQHELRGDGGEEGEGQRAGGVQGDFSAQDGGEERWRELRKGQEPVGIAEQSCGGVRNEAVGVLHDGVEGGGV